MGAREAAVPLPRPRLFAALRTRLRARVAAWVRRRQGADALPVALERRRLYILPTRGGLAFGALVFVMLLARDRSMLGSLASGRLLGSIGWIATFLLIGMSIVLVVTSVTGI
jgi:hypothetical protein